MGVGAHGVSRLNSNSKLAHDVYDDDNELRWRILMGPESHTPNVSLQNPLAQPGLSGLDPPTNVFNDLSH